MDTENVTLRESFPQPEPDDAMRCVSPVQEHLENLHQQFSTLTEGTVATYIPELSKANPDWFGVSLVTTNGAVYETGDSREPFTIQSISKPFVYGLALEDNGRNEVMKKVGVEPTGDAFNSISLDPVTGRPRNPMINAGAIAVTGMIEGKTPQIRLRRILDMFGLYAGRELLVDEQVCRSESSTGHRNRAIGHMLRNFDMVEGDPNEAVEIYFHQCSISVTCRDLGVMAATLANRGINPVTGKQAIRGEYVENILSIMGSCGMYDSAGAWIYNIGMPAKSGVSGGVIAVLPGQLGIGVFSPPLDPHGNSVRGIRLCDALSRHCDLHLFNRPGIGRSSIRLKSTGAKFNSSRARTVEETRALKDSGDGIKLYQLQGNLVFASAEVVIRDLVENFTQTDAVIFDLKRVLSVNENACRLFYDMLKKLRAAEKPVIFTHLERALLLRRYMKAKLGPAFDEEFRAFDDNDPALEWCENRLLEQKLGNRSDDKECTPLDYELFQNLSPEEVATLAPLLTRRSYHAGDTIITAGDPPEELFFLARGVVSVFVVLASSARKRLATFSAGMTFGEMAIIDRAPRSATVVADSEVICDVLLLEDFERLGASHPAIKIKLLENLSLGLCRKLRKANRELSVFE